MNVGWNWWPTPDSNGEYVLGEVVQRKITLVDGLLQVTNMNTLELRYSVTLLVFTEKKFDFSYSTLCDLAITYAK